MTPVPVLVIVFNPVMFCDQMAIALVARMVPLFRMTLPVPRKLTASALPCVPSAST